MAMTRQATLGDDDDEDEVEEAAPKPQSFELQQGKHVMRYGAAAIAQFESMQESPFRDVSMDSHIRAFEQMRLDAGVSTNSPLEQLLVDGAIMAHVQAARLIAAGAKQSPQVAEIYLKASSRFLAESRKQVLALREYRSPVATKQVTVVANQNLTVGNQQVGCIAIETVPTASVSESEAKLLTAQTVDTSALVAMIEHQPESPVDFARDVFMPRGEVQETFAVMAASRGNTFQVVAASKPAVTDEIEVAESATNVARVGLADEHLPVPNSSKRKTQHGRTNPCLSQ